MYYLQHTNINEDKQMNNYEVVQTKAGSFYVSIIFTYSKDGRVSNYFKTREEAQTECDKMNGRI